MGGIPENNEGNFRECKESPFAKGEVRRTGGYLIFVIIKLLSLFAKRGGTACGGRFWL